MDQKQTPMTLAMVGAIAGGVTVVAFLMLMVMGGYAFSPAAFLAILIGLVVAIVLYIGFHQASASAAVALQTAPAPKPVVKAAPAPATAAAPPAASAPAPTPAAAPAPAPAPTPAPAPVAEAAPAPAPAPAAAAARPTGLSAPDGAADDLKQIKGVGPKLEKLLNGMGYWHFRQVAAWTQTEIAWVDENLEGFKGRVTRDEWVTQAKILASGGVTAFSDKVKDGGVY